MKFSRLIRIYTNRTIGKNQTLTIENEDFYYLKSVMRLKKNDIFRIFNGIDGEFTAAIDEIYKNRLIIKITAQIRDVGFEKELTLAIAIIKQERMIEAIKYAVQLGVTRIIPIISERTQFKQIPYEKFNKIIINSTEQSERFKPTELTEITSLEDLCNSTKLQQIIFANECESEVNKINNLKDFKEKIAILIGPEGGFTEDEIAMLKSYEHINSVSLGRNVLRTETAACATIANIQMLRTN